MSTSRNAAVSAAAVAAAIAAAYLTSNHGLLIGIGGGVFIGGLVGLVTATMMKGAG